MSGHSKWSQIKHKKGVADAKKGTAFSKIAKAISVAARGNPDPSQNFRLKGEIDRARAANMPSDNIERAIRRSQEKDASELSEIQMQFIGPGGAAIIVEAVTDNSNRTIVELKTLAANLGGKVAGQGTLSWMFRREGREWMPVAPIVVPDEAMVRKIELLLEALGEHDDVQQVFTNARW